MDLIQLRMFCTVAETGSLARAAEVMARVPSNLTTRLRQLEQELGADLFIREKQRIRLSPVGHNFLNYAQRILALSEEALSMNHSGEPAGPFALGALESCTATWLPSLLATFHQRFPLVNLALHSAPSDPLVDRVRAGTLAAVLTDATIEGDDLNSCSLYQDPLVLITPHSLPDIHRPGDINEQPLVAFEKGCAVRYRLENGFHRADLRPGPIHTVASWHSLLATVASGGGIAAIPQRVLQALPQRSQVKEQVLPVPLQPLTTRLVWRRDGFTAHVKALKYLIIELYETQPGLTEPLPAGPED